MEGSCSWQEESYSTDRNGRALFMPCFNAACWRLKCTRSRKAQRTHTATHRNAASDTSCQKRHQCQWPRALTQPGPDQALSLHVLPWEARKWKDKGNSDTDCSVEEKIARYTKRKRIRVFPYSFMLFTVIGKA